MTQQSSLASKDTAFWSPHNSEPKFSMLKLTWTQLLSSAVTSNAPYECYQKRHPKVGTHEVYLFRLYKGIKWGTRTLIYVESTLFWIEPKGIYPCISCQKSLHVDSVSTLLKHLRCYKQVRKAAPASQFWGQNLEGHFPPNTGGNELGLKCFCDPQTSC